MTEFSLKGIYTADIVQQVSTEKPSTGESGMKKAALLYASYIQFAIINFQQMKLQPGFILNLIVSNNKHQFTRNCERICKAASVFNRTIKMNTTIIYKSIVIQTTNQRY